MIYSGFIVELREVGDLITDPTSGITMEVTDESVIIQNGKMFCTEHIFNKLQERINGPAHFKQVSPRDRGDSPPPGDKTG